MYGIFLFPTAHPGFRKKASCSGIFFLNKSIMSKVSYYTAEGLKKLRNELDRLRDVERPNASQAIADARDKGDLSENAEYDAAKEAQCLL